MTRFGALLSLRWRLLAFMVFFPFPLSLAKLLETFSAKLRHSVELLTLALEGSQKVIIQLQESFSQIVKLAELLYR